MTYSWDARCRWPAVPPCGCPHKHLSAGYALVPVISQPGTAVEASEARFPGGVPPSSYPVLPTGWPFLGRGKVKSPVNLHCVASIGETGAHKWCFLLTGRRQTTGNRLCFLLSEPLSPLKDCFGSDRGPVERLAPGPHLFVDYPIQWQRQAKKKPPHRWSG